MICSPAVHELAAVFTSQPVELENVHAIRRGDHVEGVGPDLLVDHSFLPGCSEASSLQAIVQMNVGIFKKQAKVSEVILCKLLSEGAGNPFLVDEAGDLGRGFPQVAFTS